MQRPISSSLPTTPGVYMYKDASGRIIYVGKAIHLRKRVLSYFRAAHTLPGKTAAMMRHAVSVDTLSTGTEKEALLLEASLIKKHRPHYNIVLRDDKQYVLFRLDRHAPFPRLEVVRSSKKDGARYFGPFTSASAARETYKTLHRTFPLRRCRDKAFANRVRPCLYHHLGQCLAPCTGEVAQKDYAALIARVEMVLSGRSRELVDMLTTAMHEAAESLQFELAATLRDQISALRQTIEKQSVVLNETVDMDVVGIVPTENGLGLGLLFVRQGRLVDGRSFFWPSLELDDGPELLRQFLVQYYGPNAVPAARIVVPWLPEEEHGETRTHEQNVPAHAQDIASLEEVLSDIRGALVRIALPRNAAESQLIDMAGTNADEKAKRNATCSLAEKLSASLHTDKPIYRIECVDVSHTGGQSTRMGMVVFDNERPLPSAYRTYTMGSDDGQGDDYAALMRWATRRVEDGPPWPDLVLIDGGKGQLSAVLKAFQTAMTGVAEPLFPSSNCTSDGQFRLPFALAAIAKARNEQGQADRRAGNVSDRIFLPGRVNPLPLRAASPELLLLQHIRDSAHNYVLGRHRKARTGTALTAELLRIPGIGNATAKLLWQHFPSLEAMSTAKAETLSAIPGIGSKKAKMLAEKLAKLRKNAPSEK